MSKPGNPFAFPVPMVYEQGAGTYSVNDPGMSLRDYFAAAVLTGSFADGAHKRIAAEVIKDNPANPTAEEVAMLTNFVMAKMAYEIADAMLAEREKPTP